MDHLKLISFYLSRQLKQLLDQLQAKFNSLMLHVYQ